MIYMYIVTYVVHNILYILLYYVNDMTSNEISHGKLNITHSVLVFSSKSHTCPISK